MSALTRKASGRVVLTIIAAGAVLLLLTSILVATASASGPERVRNVKGDACRALGFGVDAFNVTIPRDSKSAHYNKTFDLGNGASITLKSPPNRSRVDFSVEGTTVIGGILFNRNDQKDGNLYDYRPDGVTQGTLKPPPRDQGNEKKAVFCFGSTASLSISAKLNGIDVPADPIPVVTNPLTWVFTVTNTGSIAVTDVDITEGTTTLCSIEGALAPGANGMCSPGPQTGVVSGSVVTRTFAATGTDPGDEDVTADTVPSYLIGVACGKGTTTGGSGLDDDPYAAFWAGPSKGEGPCPAVPISVSAEVSEDGEDQIVSVVPADGFVWDGVTGLVTIEWDAVDATDSAVPRTVQVVGEGTSIIPWCAEVVGIALSDDGWSYELDPANAIYSEATEGDICLVLQSTTPVGSDLVQTTEVFYIFDDPILIRPR